MVEQDTVLIDGFWDRIDEEIHKQNVTVQNPLYSKMKSG